MTRRIQASVLPHLAWLGALLLAVMPAYPALAQSAAGQTVNISIDSPSEGAIIAAGDTVSVGGWAADTSGTTSGIDSVTIYVDGPMEAGGTLLGTATYGASRPDVGAVLGNPAYANSGFDFSWVTRSLTPGSHTLHVYAHSVASGWWPKTITITVQGQSTSASSGSGQAQTSSAGNSGLGPTYHGMGSGSASGMPLGAYLASGGATATMGNPGVGQFNGAMGYGNPAYGAAAGYPGSNASALYANQLGSQYAGPYNPQYGASYANPALYGYGNPYGAATTAAYGYGTQYGSAYPNYGYNPYLYPPPIPNQPATAVTAPAGLTVVATAGTTVTLSWTAVPGATSYRVYQSLSSSGFTPSVVSYVSATSATVSGLTRNMPYSFEVMAVDAYGNQSPSSAIVPATTTGGA